MKKLVKNDKLNMLQITSFREKYGPKTDLDRRKKAAVYRCRL